jgi:predicted outer membrane repeat protein
LLHNPRDTITPKENLASHNDQVIAVSHDGTLFAFFVSWISHMNARNLICALACLPALSQAADLKVPKQYPNIQSALSAASPGDRILVAPGTYSGLGNINLDFRGKALTLQATSGPGSTILDAEGFGRILNLTSGENADTVIRGFTFRNGRAETGGAVFLQNSSPTFVRCIFEKNIALKGGAVYAQGGSPTFATCTFNNNKSFGNGGAIATQDALLSLNKSFLKNNEADSGGGALSIQGGENSISASDFRDNSAESGAAIWMNAGKLELKNSTFSSNSSEGQGAALQLQSGSIANLAHCTFAGNLSRSEASTLQVQPGATAAVYNSIIWGDGGKAYAGQIAFSHSYVQGGAPGNSNRDEDPRFMDAQDHNLRLNYGSPCIEAGDPSIKLMDQDPDGRPRKIGSAPDVGAYEFPVGGLQMNSIETIVAVVPHDGNPETDTALVTLRAYAYDPLLQAIAFRWSMEGQPVGDAQQVEVELTAGQRTAQLDATDARGVTTSIDQPVIVYAEPNSRPVSIAGRDLSVITMETTATVTLKGRGYDADGDELTYEWSDGVKTGERTVQLVPGRHKFTFTVTDSYGESDESTITVTVVRESKPVIKIKGDNPMQVEVFGTYTELGATATDLEDGEVAVQAEGVVETGQLGTYEITYRARDSKGNTAVAIRTVNVVDTTAPILKLIGADPIYLEFGTTFNDPGATAEDAYAGTLPVTTSGTVNKNSLGTYTITYTATDQSGNTASVTRRVIVQDTTAPVISSLTANPSSIKENNGSAYRKITISFTVTDAADPNPTKVITGVSSDPDSGTFSKDKPNDIVINSNTDVDVRAERSPGKATRVYTLTLTVTDASGNKATKTVTVTVTN